MTTSNIETRVSAHYTTDDLLGRIKAAVAAAGGDPDAMRPEDLKGVDEFHTGGLKATEHLLSQLEFGPTTRALDIGCGIGGAARHIAQATGGRVTGFDLTADYITVAKALTKAVGMADQVDFHVGSALDMPVAAGAFDLATMFHVGMNIPDKTTLLDEVARALAPGGTFAVFDIMQTAPGAVTFPCPWAEQGEFSFTEAPEVYETAAAQAGLSLITETPRRDFTLDFFKAAFAYAAEHGGPPPVGIQLLMGDTAAQKLQNYVAEVTAGRLTPVEMIFRKGA